jgi:hypothetical protein
MNQHGGIIMSSHQPYIQYNAVTLVQDSIAGQQVPLTMFG